MRQIVLADVSDGGRLITRLGRGYARLIIRLLVSFNDNSSFFFTNKHKHDILNIYLNRLVDPRSFTSLTILFHYETI